MSGRDTVRIEIYHFDGIVQNQRFYIFQCGLGHDGKGERMLMIMSQERYIKQPCNVRPTWQKLLYCIPTELDNTISVASNDRADDITNFLITWSSFLKSVPAFCFTCFSEACLLDSCLNCILIWVEKRRVWRSLSRTNSLDYSYERTLQNKNSSF